MPQSMLLTNSLSSKCKGLLYLLSSQGTPKRHKFLSNILFLFSAQKLVHAQEKKCRSSFVSFLQDTKQKQRPNHSLTCYVALVQCLRKCSVLSHQLSNPSFTKAEQNKNLLLVSFDRKEVKVGRKDVNGRGLMASKRPNQDQNSCFSESKSWVPPYKSIWIFTKLSLRCSMERGNTVESFGPYCLCSSLVREQRACSVTLLCC